METGAGEATAIYSPAIHVPQQTDEELDALAAKHVSLSLLKKERDLYRTKWFDYRFMHPATATREFANQYRLAHARVMQRRIDVVQGQFKTGLPRKDLFELPPGTITSLWRARQFADEICAPYDWLLITALYYAEERCWTNMPRPQQLYSEEFTTFLKQARAEDCLIKIRTADHEFYRAPAFEGHPYQLDYQEYLVSLVKARGLFLETARSLLRNGHMMPSTIEKEWGAQAVAGITLSNNISQH